MYTPISSNVTSHNNPSNSTNSNGSALHYIADKIQSDLFLKHEKQAKKILPSGLAEGNFLIALMLLHLSVRLSYSGEAANDISVSEIAFVIVYPLAC